MRFGGLRAAMAAGDTAFGFGVSQLRGAAPAMIASSLGYQWLFVDLEHSVIGLRDASDIAIAAMAQGISPLVRCSKAALDEGARLLDNGAAGLVVPHVNNIEEAEAAIRAVRYPPRGTRSLSSLLPQLDHDGRDWKALVPELNRAFMLFLMIESAEACGNVTDILALDGFDGLFIGASDLAADMGLPGQPDHPDVVQACCAIAGAAARIGRWTAVGGSRTEATVASLHASGARMFLAGADLAFARAGARQAIDRMQGAVAQV